MIKMTFLLQYKCSRKEAQKKTEAILAKRQFVLLSAENRKSI